MGKKIVQAAGVLFLSLVLVVSLPPVSANVCTIRNLKVTFPLLVEASRPFSVITSFTVSCDALAPRMVKVQLRDLTNGKVLSTVATSQTGYYVTVVNVANATSTIGFWEIDVQISVVGADAMGMVGSGQQVVVGSYYQMPQIPTPFRNQTEPVCKGRHCDL